MKRLLFYTLALTIVFAAAVHGQSQAGCRVKYIVKYEGESIQLNICFQNNNLKMDKNSSSGNETFLFANGISVVIYPAQQIYAEYSDIKDTLLTAKPPLFGNVSDELKLTKTEIKEKIAGVECEKWILKNQITSVEMWVNKEIQFNKSFIDLLPKYSVDWQKVVKEENVLPLLVDIKDDLGNTIYSFQASDVDFKAPGKDVFILPANFKKQAAKKEI
jgi:hypothetical protein